MLLYYPLFIEYLILLICVSGILTGGLDDFDTVQDLHDAIGDVLVELDPDKTQDDVLEICDRLFCIMKQ